VTIADATHDRWASAWMAVEQAAAKLPRTVLFDAEEKAVLKPGRAFSPV
jgi:hypothetical protein